MREASTKYPRPTDEALEKRLLEYILAVTARDPWSESIPGVGISYRDAFKEYRALYNARRSIAQLYSDAKNDPFPLSSNLGIGIEQIFGERLIPTLLANTVDLEPMVQALGPDGKNLPELADFHDRYRRYDLKIRFLHDESTREVLTVGGVCHKWVYQRRWKTRILDLPVYLDGQGQPIFLPNEQTGQLEPFLADPQLPIHQQPPDPLTGQPLKIGSLGSAKRWLDAEGPSPVLRRMDCLRFPANATSRDPDEWDWVSEDFEVSPWWLLGREGEATGSFKNLKKLWAALGLNPDALYEKPLDTAALKITLREWHGKYPAATDGSPMEILAVVAPKQNLLLDWRLSPFPRRPYFIRSVWQRGNHPLGKGIPETTWALRAGMDAQLNQDLDSGNLYNHPPLLLSHYAMLDDEDYEQSGPGTRWIVSDINGAKFLPPPVSQRSPVEMLNWLIGMAQRLWAVTDLTLNAPTSALSPNLQTARGMQIVQSEGNIKFAHLVRALALTDTQEMQFTHDLFADMLKYPKTTLANGKVREIDKKFFSPDVKIVSRGDGLSTNPAIRQQQQTQFYGIMKDNPFIGEPETLFDLTKQLAESYGLKLDVKLPEHVKQLLMMQELLKTPQGQAHFQMAVAEIQAAQQGAGNGLPRPPVTQGAGTPRTVAWSEAIGPAV